MKLIALTGVTLLLTVMLGAQSPIPTRGGGAGRQAGQGPRGGGPPDASTLPSSPAAVALPSMTAPVGGPGPIFESLMALPAGDDLAHFKYEAVEKVVSGSANGQP